MGVDVVGGVDASRVEQLAAYVRPHRLTEHLVRDALDAGYAIEDAFQMDEFTIDLVVAAEGVWLVYDTT
ncbi:MAG: hypothetical protein H6737_11440 [Alphaproteobacteria bacterium]|nr:hypothetical protein [Alphaproteobacteria bacterium]